MKQNITRDIEGKNYLTIVRGEWEVIMGREHHRNYCKAHMDKINGEGGGVGGRWFQLGLVGGMGRKGIQL